MSFLGDSVVKNLPAKLDNVGLTPWLWRSPGEWNGDPGQYSCLGNHIDRETYQTTVNGVTKFQIWISNNKGKWTKLPLDEYERKKKEAVLKFNIQKTKIMVSCPITSWQLDGEKVERQRDFKFVLWPARFFCPGMLQARILEWIANPFSRTFLQPRDGTWVPIADRFFTIWATTQAW